VRVLRVLPRGVRWEAAAAGWAYQALEIQLVGERLDPRNGLAACPAHDVAFDTGMITVTGGPRIHLARPLADAVLADRLTRQYYGQPPLRQRLLLPEDAQPPARKYLDWHRERIFHR
jgi:putative restriction endonuclease